MRKLTEYFLGDEATWSDIVWFYGFYTLWTVIILMVYITVY